MYYHTNSERYTNNLANGITSHSPCADAFREFARITDNKDRSPPVLFIGIITTPTLSRTVTLKIEIRGAV